MTSAAPASARDLDAYRARADRFIARLDEEYYLHFAGHKEKLELEPIYDEFADLTTLEQARSIGAAVNGSASIRELWRFACEGYLGQLTKKLEEQLADGRGRADGDGRRRGDPVPDAEADDHERARPRQARAASSACGTSSSRST